MCGQWRLDQQDLDTYSRDGLLKSPFRIPDEQLGRMRESLDKLMRDNAHLAPETLVCPHIPYGRTHDEAAAGFVVRYMPATSVFERATGDEHVQSGITFSMSKRPIRLLRGRDRSGRNDFSVGHGKDYALVPRVSDEEGAEPE